MTEGGGRPFRPFTVALSGGNWTCDPAGDSGDGGVQLRRGDGSGARLRLCGCLQDRAWGQCSLKSWSLNYVILTCLYSAPFQYIRTF
jgi:hypothetical protein